MQRTPIYLFTLCTFALCGLLTLWLAFGSYTSHVALAQITPSDISSVDVNNAPDAATELNVTVGTDLENCALTNTITVSMGTLVRYCYLLENKSKYTLTTHSLVDPVSGLQGQRKLVLTPSSGMTPAVEIPGFARVDFPIDSTVTWVATSTNGLVFTATSKVHVNMPTLDITAAVSLDPKACGGNTVLDLSAGSQVYYCYRVRNSGTMTLTVPKIDGPATLKAKLPLLLKPGAGVNLTATAAITQTTEQVISLTGYTKTGLTTLAQAQTTARVPAIQLSATAGLVAGQCASEEALPVPVGTVVYYCYTISNLGGVLLTDHRAKGSAIPGGSDDLSFDLTGSANAWFTLPVTETRVHSVTWISWNRDNLTTSASALVTTTALTTLTVEVFYDVNGINNREALEPPLPNAQLTLSYPNGVPITATTNDAGLLVLANIPARLYTATVVNRPRGPNFPYVASTGAATRRLDLRNRLVIDALFGFTLLPAIDDDHDSIPNQHEGAGDEDKDGIPNYLDYSPKIFTPLIKRSQ